MKHRYDIDGLRAVAVLPIVLFHAGVAAIQGGFIGVDIFFIISGFLITSIIMKELETGRFSILGFYRRRIVRIFPALFLLIGVVLLAGCLLMLPTEVDALGKSAAATAAFASNIYFWATADYFATSAELKPLLHTWSLGVEEQFYIFFPLLVVLLVRFARLALRWVILVLTVLSFGVSLYLASRNPDAGFYLLPSRAWELGLGALVALGAFPAVRSRRGRDALSLIGIALIVAGYVLIDSARPFPAPWALFPCLGTALLIAYGETAVTARVLEMPPMRWIGAISYSLYLALAADQLLSLAVWAESDAARHCTAGSRQHRGGSLLLPLCRATFPASLSDRVVGSHRGRRFRGAGGIRSGFGWSVAQRGELAVAAP